MSVEQSSVASPEEVFGPGDVAALEGLQLDVQFTEHGPVLEELMRPTDDGCGHTCDSACTSCP